MAAKNRQVHLKCYTCLHQLNHLHRLTAAFESKYAKLVIDAGWKSRSATDLLLVVAVELTTPFVFLASAKRRITNCIQEGTSSCAGLMCEALALTTPSYVEMLKSQQSQLVTGLQELYRRSQCGEGWTGPALKETVKGTPLTHDILQHLGALTSGSA